MSEQRVSGRYAKSLIVLAQERNALNEVYADMLAFETALASIPALANMLKSPIIHTDKKQAILQQVFSKHFNALTLLFLDKVTAKKREFFLGDMAHQFIVQYNEINKITKASVKTATEVSESALHEVRTFLEKETGKKVVLSNQVDSPLIGGMVIQIEDRLYDASISGKLKKVKQDLLNTYISK